MTLNRRSAISLLGLAGLAPFESAAKDLPLAPEFSGGPWLNTPGEQPLRLAARRGKVTLVHFWAFACGNCRANMPSYNRWHEEFAGRGVAVVGIHTPELDREREPKFVAEHIAKYGVQYPVLLDNDMSNWQRWKQQYWPTAYVVDQQGRIRASWIGELEYRGQQGEAKIAKLVRELLA
jgi:thiol-disulfide isomerase/thioredoxin